MTGPTGIRVLSIAMVAPRGSQTLDIVGPIDAFSQANQVPGSGVRYDISLVGTAPGPIVASSGVRLLPDRFVDEAMEPFDTLLVAGSPDFAEGSRDRVLSAWLAHMAPMARRVGSICNGAFILGAAGLLNGRRATTHWQFASELAVRHPEVRVEPDQIFVQDGNIFSSAGVTAGIDLSLALIEQDCGPTVSLAVARALVVFLRRPGGQSQFSVHLQAQLTTTSQLADVSNFIIANLSGDLSIVRLARHAAMSERSLARLFQDELRTTPARFVEVARIEAARSLLEASALNIQQIAHHCGFGSTDTMRRAFARHLSISPGDYRLRFRGVQDSQEAPSRI